MSRASYTPIWREPTVDRLFFEVCTDLLAAPVVNTGTWQSKQDTSMSLTREILNARIELPISSPPGGWASYMRPNLPWADEHFSERVSGKPLNPPPSHVNWPYNREGNKDHMDGEAFSHSYPERLWSKQANHGSLLGRQGIRYRYGDLDDLVNMLIRNPYTRQAYVPLWFPEDLAASVEGQRVPCTLGYHFILRSERLHCFYPMRSLDWLRYFRDDAYMAGRLCQWLIHQCRTRRTGDDNNVWHEVEPGRLTMHVVSLHCFEGDIPIIKHQLTKSASRYEILPR